MILPVKMGPEAPANLEQIVQYPPKFTNFPSFLRSYDRGKRDADHRRPCWLVPPLHQPVPLGHGRDAERLMRRVVLSRGVALFPLKILPDGAADLPSLARPTLRYHRISN